MNTHAALSASFEGLRDMAAREPYGSLAEQLQDALTDELDTLEADHDEEIDALNCEIGAAESQADEIALERDNALYDVENLKDEIAVLKKRFNAAWASHPGARKA